MADAGGPLFELHIEAAKHLQSLEVELGELARRPDPETVQKVKELQQLLAELRGLLC
ncbi:MAG: hypothetical protein ACJ8EP_04845 [Sphingomicrobium sp.]